MPASSWKVQKMLRECQFIRAEGRIWIPTPSSWLGGWARQRWLEDHFGNDAPLSIASCESWGRLYHENDVYVLEEESGKYTEKIIKGKKKKKKKKKG